MEKHRLNGDFDDYEYMFSHQHDLKARIKILGKNWDDIYHLVRMNPMAATFEWSDLVEKAFLNEEESLDFTKSVHIWKAMAHTRWRRDCRHKYMSVLENKMKNKYFEEACKAKQKYSELLGWIKHVPEPDEFERKFSQWYLQQVIIMYRKMFLTEPGETMNDEEEEKLVQEFGWQGKKYSLTPGKIRDVSDNKSLPAQEDEWGNEVDEFYW